MITIARMAQANTAVIADTGAHIVAATAKYHQKNDQDDDERHARNLAGPATGKCSPIQNAKGRCPFLGLPALVAHKHQGCRWVAIPIFGYEYLRFRKANAQKKSLPVLGRASDYFERYSAKVSFGDRKPCFYVLPQRSSL
jgi:hypothetical protein